MAGAVEAPEAPQAQTNRIGLQKKDYAGSKSTLCIGCGHDLITARLIDAAYENNLKPEQVIKLSGIGCSSKTPAYFMSRSFSFNSVHGRMPSIATGATLANRTLKMVGVSGDGDTANIGIGQFVHLMRRNLDLVYIVENNGVYGLTKGQFSATADLGSTMKGGKANDLMPMDCCEIAIHLGCGFVARSFSGDLKQLRPLLKAAFSHRGTAVIDVISPCVTFADHEGSTKSYAHVKDVNAPLHDIDFVPYFEDIHVDYAPGTSLDVTMPDGSHIFLKKLDKDYVPNSRSRAMRVLEEARDERKLVTGLLYIEPRGLPFEDELQLVETPLAKLALEQVRPPKQVLDEVMESLKTGKA